MAGSPWRDIVKTRMFLLRGDEPASALPWWLALAVLLGATLPGPVALAERHHTVRRRDNLWRIARRYRIDVHDLALANGYRTVRGVRLRPGQVLDVPPRGVRYARRGDSLRRIARRCRSSVRALRRVNGLTARHRVRVGDRFVCPGTRAARRHRIDWGKPPEPGVVTFRDRRGNERRLRVRDEQGRVLASALDALAELMRRDDGAPLVRPVPRLAALLAAISDHFGGRTVEIVSGVRRNRRTRRRSYHRRGAAADIRVEGVPRRLVWDYCRTLRRTGCGYYPRNTFTHVDVRDIPMQWVDWSRPGRRSRYGSLRGPGRKRRRKMAATPRRYEHAQDLPLQVTVAQDVPGHVAALAPEASDPARR